MLRQRLAAILAASVIVASAVSCSSESTTNTTNTMAAAERPAYEGNGPHQVGSRTIALADGRRVVIWYPAVAAAANTPEEVFDIAGLLSAELQAKVPADLRPKYRIRAHVDAAPATDGPFPVVLFSHGFAGFPEQSADLTTHLASWGFVVIAPDHVERSLSGLLGGAAEGVPKMDDPAVLSASLDVAIADAAIARSTSQLPMLPSPARPWPACSTSTRWRWPVTRPVPAPLTERPPVMAG